MAPSDAYLQFDSAITHASGDRAELKRIRDADLHGEERNELLERARYVPGCFPPKVELAGDTPALAGA